MGLPPRFSEIEEKTEPWMRWLLGAFFDISKDRPTGFGIASIPWSSINSYLIAHGFSGNSLAEHRRLLLNMDDHFVAKKVKENEPGPIRETNPPTGAED